MSTHPLWPSRKHSYFLHWSFPHSLFSETLFFIFYQVSIDSDLFPSLYLNGYREEMRHLFFNLSLLHESTVRNAWRKCDSIHSDRGLLYLALVTLMLTGEENVSLSQWEGHRLSCGTQWNSMNAWKRVHELPCGSSSTESENRGDSLSHNVCVSMNEGSRPEINTVNVKAALCRTKAGRSRAELFIPSCRTSVYWTLSLDIKEEDVGYNKSTS